MKISALISALQRAKEQHGDLPVYTIDADIDRIQIHPCRDGATRIVNGVPEKPNELVLEFIPA